MSNLKYHIVSISVFLSFLNPLFAQKQTTYCNPVNIDYGYTPIPNFAEAGKHRATADPVIVNYKGDYYLFSTNQWGYWWSNDMLKWNFISHKFLRPWNEGYDELCAPAVSIIGDTMLVFGSTYTRSFTIWMSTDPKNNKWKPMVNLFDIGGWDPAFFTDDNGRFYMYNGSSNRFPIYSIELNRKTLQPGGFARGAGHGATFRDHWNNYWHVSTIAISVKNNFERRIGIWPAGFDEEGIMYCNQAFGDFSSVQDP